MINATLMFLILFANNKLEEELKFMNEKIKRGFVSYL